MDFETEYNARAAIPDHPALFDAWTARSTQARGKATEALDIRYGDGERETLDFFPAMRPDAPIVVYVHGGYWQWNDKNGFSFLAEAMVHEGCSVAVLNYPLSPTANIPAICEAVRRAVAFVHDAASTRHLRGDPDRLYMVGHSAGAHLAVTALATDWTDRTPARDAAMIKGVLAISGIYDLRPLVHTTMNEGLMLTEETAKVASPVFMEPKTKAPLTLAVGALESEAFHRQSRDLAEVWRGHGVPVGDVMTIPDRNHLTVLEELAAPDGRLLRAVCDMVGGC